MHSPSEGVAYHILPIKEPDITLHGRKINLNFAIIAPSKRMFVFAELSLTLRLFLSCVQFLAKKKENIFESLNPSFHRLAVCPFTNNMSFHICRHPSAKTKPKSDGKGKYVV